MDVNNVQNFSASLNSEIVNIGRRYAIEIDEKLPLYPAERQELDSLPSNDDTKLGRLMSQLTQNWKQEHSVVVLIDEYDYPKRRNSPLYHRYNPIALDSMMSWDTFLNPFFYELERVKRFIKFSFLTCTAKVAYHYRIKYYPDTPVTLKDLTLDPQYSKMMGLTGAELRSHLKPHITAMISQPNETFYTLSLIHISEPTRPY